MKGVLVSEETVPAISEEAHSFFTLYGAAPVLVLYSDRTVALYHAANGRLIKQLSVAERIECVACCPFTNYGSCVAILLNSSCVIWSDSEQMYSVPLPCRMSSLHPLSNGLLFERVDDLGSMNVSFTITSATTSIPVYYSLSSPISIPKPVYQPQDGVVLPDVSNASVSELSHVVDLSMNFSIVDLFNSRVDVSRFDRDVVIVSSIPQYHLLVTYNRNSKEHQLIQLCDVHSKRVGVTSRTELMLRELHQSDVSMKDRVFESLNSPDLCMITLFSAVLQDEPCLSVTVKPSFFDTSSFILYFATTRALHCYRLTGFSTDDDALSTAGVSLISVLEGEFVGEWNDSSLLLKNAILLRCRDAWTVVLDGHAIYQSAVELPENVTISSHCMHSGILSSYNAVTHTLQHISFDTQLTESVDSLLALFPILSHASFSALPSLSSLDDVATTLHSLQPVATLHACCLLLDSSWARRDGESMHALRRLVLLLVSGDSTRHTLQERVECYLQCYAESDSVGVSARYHE